MGQDKKSSAEIWLDQKVQQLSRGRRIKGQVIEDISKLCEQSWIEECIHHMGKTTFVLPTTLSIPSSSVSNCGIREKLTSKPKRQRLDLDDIFAFRWGQTLHYMLLGYDTGRLLFSVLVKMHAFYSFTELIES